GASKLYAQISDEVPLASDVSRSFRGVETHALNIEPQRSRSLANLRRLRVVRHDHVGVHEQVRRLSTFLPDFIRRKSTVALAVANPNDGRLSFRRTICDEDIRTGIQPTAWSHKRRLHP